MFSPIDVSTSALIAERQRMNTIADNIANSRPHLYGCNLDGAHDESPF